MAVDNVDNPVDNLKTEPFCMCKTKFDSDFSQLWIVWKKPSRPGRTTDNRVGKSVDKKANTPPDYGNGADFFLCRKWYDNGIIGWEVMTCYHIFLKSDL